MILLVSDCPTPQHTPVYNRLHEEFGDRFQVVYLLPRPPDSRGWGAVAVRHRHAVWGDGIGWRRLLRLLCSADLGAVVVNGYAGPVRQVTSLVARLRGLPSVLRAEANVRDELARPRFRRAVKRWYLRAVLGQPEIWTNGSANEAYWRLLGLRRHHRIPYALCGLPGGAAGAPALRAGLGVADRFVFAFVGRLEPVKGIADILAAYDRVRAEVAPAATALLLVGSGSLEPVVRAHAVDHPDCHHLGPLPQRELGAVYAAADVLLVPSVREPWGWVVNEALGFGTRVIASHEVAAADDLVREETGRRCPASDPVALAEAMLAEYRRGRRPAPVLPPEDTSGAMARRLRELVPDRPDTAHLRRETVS